MLCVSIPVSADYHLSFSNLIDVVENGADGSFTINIIADGTSAITDTVTVIYTTSNPPPPFYEGKAKMGIDYYDLPLTLIIPIIAGRGSITIPIKAIDDRLVEYSESFPLVIQSATAHSGAIVNLPERPGFIGISDDDEGQIISFKSKTDGTEGGADPTVTIGFPDGYLASESIVIRYDYYRGTALGSDIIDEPTIIIPEGQNSVTVSLPLLDDYKVEGTEYLTMGFNEAYGADDNYFIYPAIGTIDIFIFDNDTTRIAIGTVTLIGSGDGFASTEGDAGHPCIFYLHMQSLGDLPFAAPITISFGLSGTATHGMDYTLPDSVVIPSFAGADSLIKITVPALDDNVVEGNEYFEVHISGVTAPAGTTLNFFSNPAYLNIIDVDSSRITIAAAANGKEAALPGSITLSYSDDLVAAEDVHVDYHINPSGTTATQGIDFTIPELLIPAGQHSTTFPIIITNDTAIEGTEYIKIVTDSAYGNKLHYPVGPVTDTVIAIEDNDSTATHCEPVKLIIPNVITPNGDGRNDKFVIRGLEKYPNSRLYIYDLLRSGRLVYQSNDYRNDWEGQGCYPGLYVYRLEVKEEGKTKIYKGKLIIIR